MWDLWFSWQWRCWMLLFSVVTLCGLLGKYQHFREAHHFHCQEQKETVCFSEMLVSTYKSTWWHSPEEHYCYNSVLKRVKIKLHNMISLPLVLYGCDTTGETALKKKREYWSGSRKTFSLVHVIRVVNERSVKMIIILLNTCVTYFIKDCRGSKLF
jgi:hypothetical protein